MKKTITNNRVEELKGYAEIGSYMYRNNGTGKVSVKMHTSVNKPLELDSADEILKIKKIRVETHVIEDKNLSDGIAYQKDVETIQKTDNGAPMNETFDGTDSMPGGNGSGNNSGEPSGLQVLKNFVDNIAADVRDNKNLQTVLFLLIGVIAVSALILSIV